MNVLVIGGGSWDDTTSLGNTFSNLFYGWEDVKFYNLYFRDTLPNNCVCEEYFRITTKEILKKFLKPRKIGQYFQYSQPDIHQNDERGEKEKRAISLIHRYGLKCIYDLEDFLWNSKKWQNANLDKFIEMVNPDIIFSFAAGNNYITLPIEYIKAKTNAKVVLFIADDMHTTYRLDNNSHHRKLRDGFDKLMLMADKVYGISQEMCDYYKHLYGVDVSLLHKGCCFENQPKKAVNKPLKLVYAGNLLFGRLETLISLVDCLERLYDHGIAASLDIYSTTIITEEQTRMLNRKNVSHFHGGISYSEVRKRMADADVVLHVESFDQEQIKQVRYSFSTKIIDCLQSGSVMLAIGPEGISSIEYPRQIPGAIVVDDLSKLFDILFECFSKEDEMIGRATQIRDFALKNHSIESVRNSLSHSFKLLCGSSVE